MKQSEIYYQNNLPANIDFKQSILIYDKVLERNFKKWISKFSKKLKVTSGEKLKSLELFSSNAEKILNLSDDISRKNLTIISFGGGSVGDFSGFVASVLKRGVGLVHIPSTWLSAIDSSHGGKTALNSKSSKNQIGTFYSASKIFIIREVLFAQPAGRIRDVRGEYYKTVFIGGGDLYKEAAENKDLTAEFLWKQLPKLINVKQKIVKIDPYEEKGIRHILNLGHTVGHVIESKLGLAHGEAVWLGLAFAIEWGHRLGLSPWALQYLPTHFLPEHKILSKILKKIKDPESILIKDKKISGKGELQFIFIKTPGDVFVKKVNLKGLVKEWNRQAAL